MASAWTLLANRKFLALSAFSLAFFAAGVIAAFSTGIYATDHESNYVTDIILSNIPVFQVDGLFLWGTFVLLFSVLAICLWRLEWTPFIVSSLGFFYLIRSVFVSLTHIAPFPEHATLDVGQALGKIIAGGDMFFSGHTGAPFLLALIFWQHLRLRYFFLAWSIFFAIIVLLGHLHYSIDVLSAYFITFTIYELSRFFFKRAHALFHEGLATL